MGLVEGIYGSTNGSLVTEQEEARQWTAFHSAIAAQNKHWTGNDFLDRTLRTWFNRLFMWKSFTEKETNLSVQLVCNAFYEFFKTITDDVVYSYGNRLDVDFYLKYIPNLHHIRYLYASLGPERSGNADCNSSLYFNLNPKYDKTNIVTDLFYLSEAYKKVLS